LYAALVTVLFLLHCPPLPHRADMSTPAFSTPQFLTVPFCPLPQIPSTHLKERFSSLPVWLRAVHWAKRPSSAVMNNNQHSYSVNSWLRLT